MGDTKEAKKDGGPDPFEDWWSEDGRFIDPDFSDVPWFDKRKGLAERAFVAGASWLAKRVGEFNRSLAERKKP